MLFCCKQFVVLTITLNDLRLRGGHMKYLITGGAGFIGSHLCDELLSDGANRVFIIDDLSTGNIENIVQHKENPRFSYTIESIMNKAVLRSRKASALGGFFLTARLRISSALSASPLSSNSWALARGSLGV